MSHHLVYLGLNLNTSGLSARLDGGKYLSIGEPKLLGDSNASVAMGDKGAPGFGGRYFSICELGGVLAGSAAGILIGGEPSGDLGEKLSGGEPSGDLGSKDGDLGLNGGEVGSKDGDLGANPGDVGGKSGEVGTKSGLLGPLGS